MYFEPSRRQKGNIEKGLYGENNRQRITQLVIETKHLKALEAIHRKKNSSKSYILEEMLKYALIYGEIREKKIIRLKSLPVKKVKYIGSHTISKNILSQIRALAKKLDTTLSVVIWELLTLFFLAHPLYLQEEYLTS